MMVINTDTARFFIVVFITDSCPSVTWVLIVVSLFSDAKLRPNPAPAKQSWLFILSYVRQSKKIATAGQTIDTAVALSIQYLYF